jgi:hypothetical protein
MTPQDMTTIRAALYRGQISAIKVDAQRAFARLEAALPALLEATEIVARQRAYRNEPDGYDTP